MNTLSGIKSKIWNFHLYLYFHSVNETLTINFVYFTSETLLLGTSQFINIYVSYPPERFMQWKTVTKFFKLLFMAAEWRQHFRVQGHRLSHIAWPHGVYQPIFFFSDKETKTNIHGSLTMSLSRDGKIHSELITNQMTEIVTMPS